MIRTVLVDDEILSRIGIQSLIDGKENISVVGVFGCAEDALEALQSDPVDIVITDIEMSQMNGLEFIRRIRDFQLARGIIILSCHDDFSYAQEAISRGTDSYLLKYGISEQSLVAEIKKVYEKTHQLQFQEQSTTQWKRHKKELRKGCTYVVGVLQAFMGETDSENQFDDVMLSHLLEDILFRYQMGNYYAPFDKESFIVFQLDRNLTVQEQDKILYDNYSIIRKSIQQYTSVRFACGLSTPFYSEKDICTHYNEAVSALAMSFYDQKQTIFRYEPSTDAYFPNSFSTEHFLEEGGDIQFINELSDALQTARFSQTPVNHLREQLIQAVNTMLFKVTREYGFSEDRMQEWNFGAKAISAITLATNVEKLELALSKTILDARTVMLSELDSDEMLKAFHYINAHLKEKITLGDLTDLCCMSAPSFSKKFKERTGLTLVQYLNNTRIQKAKSLLKNKEYTLQQVAEETGFSSTNYLVRVFKKVEGTTIGDYRKQFGIMTAE